jgi:hypothetical protein
MIAGRITKELLNMGDCKIMFDFDTTEIFEEEEESPSYPGVRTVYRKEIIEGFVTTTKATVLKRIGCESDECKWSFEDNRGNTKFFEWLSEDECEEKEVELCAPESAGEELSCLVDAPIGFSEEKLRDFLSSNGINTDLFGSAPGSKTVKALAEESKLGETSFAMEPDGSVLRVVDVVLLRLSKDDGTKVLVQADEATSSDPDSTKVLNRLPGQKLRPTDNQFVTAYNILKKQLQIDENCVNLHPDKVEIRESAQFSNSYPGLLTLYRHHVIYGEVLIKGDMDPNTPVSP